MISKHNFQSLLLKGIITLGDKIPVEYIENTGIRSPSKYQPRTRTKFFKKVKNEKHENGDLVPPSEIFA